MMVHVDIFQTSSVNILVKQDGRNADHSLNSHILDKPTISWDNPRKSKQFGSMSP